jgi:hypothetical protein
MLAHDPNLLVCRLALVTSLRGRASLPRRTRALSCCPAQRSMYTTAIIGCCQAAGFVITNPRLTDDSDLSLQAETLGKIHSLGP